MTPSFRTFLLLIFLFSGGLMFPVRAETTVYLGTIRPFTGPTDPHLDFSGIFRYAINFSQDDPVRTVNGLTFQPDNQAIPGAGLIGPQNVVGWQTKPEFGDSAEADALEEIMHDIRWASAGSGEKLQAILAAEAGIRYKLQILISGNQEENRNWDIRLNGQQAVDEISSLGVNPGAGYSATRSMVWTCEFVAPTSSVSIEMGDFFGANDGGDRNPIWQALTLERIHIPPAPEDITLSATSFFAEQTAEIGEVRVMDEKFAAMHNVAFAPGPGDQDNSKFSLVDARLVPAPFDFSMQVPGASWRVRLRATDSGDASRFLEKSFTLSLAQPHAPTGVSLNVSSLNIGMTPGQSAGHLDAADGDGFDRHQFSLAAGNGDADNNYFRIEGGELRLVNPLPAGVSSLSLRLRAVDLAGLSVESVIVLPVLSPRVRINEVLAVPTKLSRPLDQNALTRDWIEIHNEQSQPVNLEGWYLSDNPDDLTKWTFPAISLDPDGYLLVFASGTGAVPAAGPPHTNFSLSQEGERLLLTRPDGVVQDDVRLPEMFPNVTWGIGQGAQTGGYLLSPTPVAANTVTAAAGSNPVSFSVPHGFKTAAFPLELTAPLPDSVIRYTLDGSPPKATSPVYSGPLEITPVAGTVRSGTRIVRAVAVHPEAPWSPVGTQSYLFVNGVNSPASDGIAAQSNFINSIRNSAVYGPLLDDALLSLPAVSLVINNPSGLPLNETESSLELFDPDHGEAGFTVPAGVARSGTSSLNYPKGSMSARFRGEYGASRLEYPVYAGNAVGAAGAATEFQELRLRSCSHDSLSWLGSASNPSIPYGSPPVTRRGDAQFMRNNWIEDMQMLMGQPGKHGRMVNMFVNGNYYGLYHIQEHADEDYMASYFPGGSEDYHFTGGGTTGSDHGGGNTWRQPWAQLKSSLANYTQAQRWVDVTNLADYMVLMFFIGNDWDWSAQHNWGAAGPRLPDHGGWKFFSQDQDVSLQDVNADCTDQTAPDGVFNRLMSYPDFKVLFRDRIYRHLFHDGVLTAARAAAHYQLRTDEIYAGIVGETARWQPSSSAGPLPWDRNGEWTVEKNYIMNTFFPQRGTKLLGQLRSRGWYPVNAPEMNQQGGTVDAGTRILLTGPAGAAVFYTLDGSDPRLPGGAVSPSAKACTAAIASRTIVEAYDGKPGQGAVWKFLVPASDPGETWKTAALDDRGWLSGAVEAGYGDGDEVTIVGTADTDPGTSGIQRNITTYFRHTFAIEDPGAVTGMIIRLKRDDGAVVYMNGREVFRSAMPDGPVTFTTPGNGGGNVSDDGGTWFSKTLTAADYTLTAGANVIAVEVHNSSAFSSDISFDLELGATQHMEPEPILVTSAATLKARALVGTEWSGMNEAAFQITGTVAASADNLVLSEIHYHPQGVGQKDAEFLEFFNNSPVPVDAAGVLISGGVNFTFPAGIVLSAGGRAVIVKDAALFDARYRTPGSPWHRDGISVVGSYAGSLANGGESLTVTATGGQPIFSMAWEDGGDWPGRADGSGSSLELSTTEYVPGTAAEKGAWLSTARNWRSSSEFHGSPGFAGAGPDNRIVFNEILAAPPAGGKAFIEFYNRSGFRQNMGGWLLSDSSENYGKFRILPETGLEPGAWSAITADQFGTAGSPGVQVPFNLQRAGGSLYLLEADKAGNPLRFVDRLNYSASSGGISLGRVPDGTGPFIPQPIPTSGEANEGAVPGYAEWAVSAFPAGASRPDKAMSADPDSDGLINLMEFALALNPVVPDAEPLTISGNPPEIQFRHRLIMPGLVVKIQVSNDLRDWDPSETEVERTSSTANPDGTATVTARIRTLGTGGRQFLRLAVSY